MARTIPSPAAVTSSLLLVAALLSGCASVVADATSTSPQQAAPSTLTPTPTPTKTAWIAENVTHHVPSEGEILASLDNKTGTAGVLGVPVTKKHLKVWVVCSGPATYFIDIKGLGRFELPCDQGENAASENQFELTRQGAYDISVESKPGQRWAMTVQQVDR